MAINILRMKPSECCRTLNCTPLGTVINDRQLYRYRTRAGHRIGDGKHLHLLKFTGLMIEDRHRPKTIDDTDAYDKHKDYSRERNAAKSLAGRDIGELPSVADANRKAKAADSFRYFCEAYFSLTFHLS